ncbi:hypothetical protein [Nocardia cyriacigeorgica]|uniref:hypothetical protein n=1 Tax=Nocardia cyriacigeorgica TaxID=135487 RepID=UPI0013D52DC5|nr:hypothetical protein [Nocardia cyriacigeorgica]NEW27270.1 hypothetical protein [Nocardia cyriacigeorgica]
MTSDQTSAPLPDEQLEARLAEMMARAWRTLADQLGLPTVDDLIAERDNLRDTVADLVRLRNAAETDADETRALLNEARARITELEAERDLWRERAEKGQLHRHGLVTEACALRARVAELEAADAQAAEAVSKTVARFSAALNERDRLRARVAELEDHVAALADAEMERARLSLYARNARRTIRSMWESRRHWQTRATELEAELPYREVWSDETPPGGLVCSVCGQPVESEPCRDHAPAGYVVGWQDKGQFRITYDDGEITHPNFALARVFLAEVTAEDPDTEYRVYELREVADRD